MNPLEAMTGHYADRCAAARAWKARGGRVVGYLCDNVPDELVSAAGFLPLRISGNPEAGFGRVGSHVDSLFPPDVTSRAPFVAALLEALLDGTYDFIDHLIVPHNRNSIQALYRELQEASREHPELPQYDMHYLDKAWSSSFVSETYNRDCIFDLKTALEAWSGEPITDAALNHAIAVSNRNKELLRQVAELRAARPSRLSGADALRIIGASMVMPKAEHNELVQAFLQSAGELSARDGPRIFLGGSPQDHTRVYEAIEACGATIVAEDHCWGNRSFDLPVETDTAPMLALAGRFHLKPACSISFPLSQTVAACARRAAAASADGAIFYVMDEDWSQNWETPNEMRAVEAGGMPSLHLKRQAYDGGDLEALKATVSAFLGQLADRKAALAKETAA